MPIPESRTHVPSVFKLDHHFNNKTSSISNNSVWNSVIELPSRLLLLLPIPPTPLSLNRASNKWHSFHLDDNVTHKNFIITANTNGNQTKPPWCGDFYSSMLILFDSILWMIKCTKETKWRMSTIYALDKDAPHARSFSVSVSGLVVFVTHISLNMHASKMYNGVTIYL